MEIKKHPVFIKGMYGVIIIFALSIGLYFRSHQSKNSFQKISGRINYVNHYYEHYPVRDYGKYRYIRIEGYPKVLELFTANERGDFSPEFENIDSLSRGDYITVYFDENSYTQNDPVNRLVQFIDRGGRPVYIRSPWEKYLSYFLLAVDVLLFGFLLYLKKMGRID